MVLVVANRIPIAKGWEAEFEKRWANRKWSIAQLPGFIRTEVLRPVKGDYYVVMTHWRSKEDFERWTESAAFGERESAAKGGLLRAQRPRDARGRRNEGERLVGTFMASHAVFPPMPRCPSCGKDVLVLCAEDGMCRDCSDCCRQGATVELGDRREP